MRQAGILFASSQPPSPNSPALDRRKAMNAHAVRTLLQRKNLAPAIVVLLFSFVIFFAVASSIAQSPAKEEREIEDRVPQHLPIKVKVKNLEKVKDLKNDHWLGDLEIEVKNTGDKPIYYLYISVILPDTKHDETGHTIGYQLWYGRPALVDLTAPILPDDVPLQPGESCTLKVGQNSVEGWEVYKAKKNIASPKKLEIRFELINFGNGTGFDGPDGAPIPFRKQGENVSCREIIVDT
jgi:hypothetical protein